MRVEVVQVTCLACGARTARDAWASAHDLGALLCLEHLLAALAEPLDGTGGNAPLSGPGPQERVPRDRCWGLALTCPRPPVVSFINARFCLPCVDGEGRRIQEPGPVPPRPSVPGPDDGMGAAVLAVLDALGGDVLHTRPGYYGTLDPLEGE